MSEDHIVRHCAPTLAGLKTGSIFTSPYESKDSLILSIRRFNKQLGHKGLRMIPLRISDKKALIYIYRPARLYSDLSDHTAIQILNKRGYDVQNIQLCVVQLVRKMRQSETFPHEIGLFLGYPPQDVIGFMEIGPCGYKCTGCWKVYSDVESAKKKFAQFKKCTSVYCDQVAKGKSIERLTVAC